MKILKYFKLEKGFFRVYFVGAIITFSISLWIHWDKVQKAQDFEQYLINGIAITSIHTDATILGGAKPEYTSFPPTAIPTAWGFASWDCLKKEGIDLGNINGVAHSKLSFKELTKILNNETFKTCRKEWITYAEKETYETKLEALFLALMSVIALYIIFLGVINVFQWIRAGF
ncbi:MAG: hypothetical protein KBD25_01065 [Rickettsiaceae bacterium]|nr:hypothetical protein [Rickettsiaceae bacterium]